MESKGHDLWEMVQVGDYTDPAEVKEDGYSSPDWTLNLWDQAPSVTLDIDGGDDDTLVDYYGVPDEKALRKLARRTANCAFLLADSEAETRNVDFVKAIHALCRALDEAGIKWTSGR